MNAKGDTAVENAADKLQQKADELAAQGGVKAKLAQPLADDAEFLRKLKPSLIKARAKGEAPTNEKPGAGRVAPSGPQLGARPQTPKQKRSGGPSPWLVIGVALAIGVVAAKVIDWRGHAHPHV
jgi:hypothetical protein